MNRKRVVKDGIAVFVLAAVSVDGLTNGGIERAE